MSQPRPASRPRRAPLATAMLQSGSRVRRTGRRPEPMPMQGYDKVKVGDVEFIEGGASRPSGYGFVITDFRGSRPVLSTVIVRGSLSAVDDSSGWLRRIRQPSRPLTTAIATK